MNACAPEDEVERSFWKALEYCEARTILESKAALACVMDRWLGDPQFQSDLSVRSVTMNEITFLLLHEHLEELTRRKIEIFSVFYADMRTGCKGRHLQAVHVEKLVNPDMRTGA